MFKKRKFDERQLKIRGDIFKHAFILVIVLLFIQSILSSNGVVWVTGMWSDMLIIVLSGTVCSIEMILRDVYIETTQTAKRKVNPYTIGILSLLMLVFVFFRILNGEPIIAQNQLTNNGVYFVYVICFASIFTAFVIKKIINYKASDNE